MNDELKEKLKGLGVSEAAIQTLEEQELTTEASLSGYTYERFTAMGIKAGSATILAAQYGPAPVPVTASTAPEAGAAAATPPGAPLNITVKTGNPEDMTVQELLSLVANGERSQDVTSVLRRKVGATRRVYVREAGTDRIDVAETMELLNQDFAPGEEPQFWGTQPTETLSEILELRRYADPLTGKPLAKGDPWLQLGDDGMAAFVYARLKGSDLISGNEDKYTLVKEATSDPAGERWIKIQTIWNRGVKSGDPMIMEARAAIIYDVKRGTTRKGDDPMRDRRRSSAMVGGGGSGDGASFREQ